MGPCAQIHCWGAGGFPIHNHMPRGRKPGPMRPLDEQIASQLQVNYTTGCWEWTGYVPNDGKRLPYGRIKVNGNKTPQCVHRLMFDMYVADIPDGMVVDHICRNARCSNLKHLRLLTPSENSDGGFVKTFREATHCVNGHPFSGDNLYERKLKNGKTSRGCRQCRRDSSARQRQKHKS